MTSNLHNNSFSINLLKKYVIFNFKRFYSEYIVVGRENIPTDSPIIFAANHLNALMDALAIHSIAPENVTVTFLARADMFSNKLVAKILRFIRIMPAFRMRDGMENLGKNNEVFEHCVDILNQNKPLGIMPEGNQGEQRKLRTFTKGIFRIAFDAQQKYGTNPGVKIIPVGIDFEDINKFGKYIIINIGKPIEISDYMAAYAKNPVIATNEIRDQLRNDLRKITLDLATETHYVSFETIVGIANSEFTKKLNLPDNTVFRFVARQKIAEKLIAIEKKEPEKIKELELLCNEYCGSLKQLNLRNWVLEKPTYKATSLLLDGFMLFATLALFIYGFILNFLPFFTPVLIRKYLIKAEYTGFFSSLHFGIGIFTFPLFYIVQTVGFSFISTSWWLTLLFLISQYVFGKWAYQWYIEAKKLTAKIRYNYLINKKSPTLERVQSIHKKIIQLISI